LKVPVPFEFCTNFWSEISSELDRDDIDDVDQMRRGIGDLVSDGGDELIAGSGVAGNCGCWQDTGGKHMMMIIINKNKWMNWKLEEILIKTFGGCGNFAVLKRLLNNCHLGNAQISGCAVIVGKSK
jgi:hypothetical protein